jgi:thiol-disulfide isomerase/thioredoxin
MSDQAPPVTRYLRHVWTVAAIAVALFVGARVALGTSQNVNASSAPHVRLATMAGSHLVIPAADHRPLVLDFYATWCAPCRQELPLIEAWARSHPDARVIPVDVGDPPAAARAYAQLLHLSNVALDPETRAQQAFQVTGFPTVVAIDTAGRIRGTWAGLNPAIADVLTQNLSAMNEPPTRSDDSKKE